MPYLSSAWYSDASCKRSATVNIPPPIVRTAFGSTFVLLRKGFQRLPELLQLDAARARVAAARNHQFHKVGTEGVGGVGIVLHKPHGTTARP